MRVPSWLHPLPSLNRFAGEGDFDRLQQQVLPAWQVLQILQPELRQKVRRCAPKGRPAWAFATPFWRDQFGLQQESNVCCARLVPRNASISGRVIGC